MADRFGIDLGNVLRSAEEIKRARIENQFRKRDLELGQQGQEQTNAMNALRLDEARRGVADENVLRSTRGAMATAAGMTPQQAALVTISPAKADEVRKFFNEADEAKRTELVNTVDQMGQAAAYVQSSADPAAAYLRVKEMMPEKVQAQMPAQYDENYVLKSLSQATEMRQLLDTLQPKEKAKPPANYEWAEDGTSLRPIKGGPADPATKAKEAGGLETAEANGIRSTVAVAFGGMYDPISGEISGLDPEEGSRMVDVVARAQEIAIAEPGIAPARAASRALAEAGMSAPAAAPATSPAPAGGAPAGKADDVIDFTELFR